MRISGQNMQERSNTNRNIWLHEQLSFEDFETNLILSMYMEY